MTGNNPNLDHVKIINAHTKFDQMLSINSKILGGNEILKEILASVKGHNSVTNVPKMKCNNSKLDLVNYSISMHIYNLVKFYQFVLKILNGNKFMTDRMTEWKMESNKAPPPIFKVGL